MTRTTIATVLLMALAMSILGGCSNKVDGSSDEAFKSSMEKIAEELSEEDKEKLGKAMVTIMFAEMAKVAETSKGDMSNVDGNKVIREKLDGMTADEIIAMGEKMEKEGKGIGSTMGKMIQNAFKNAGPEGTTPPMPAIPVTPPAK